MLALYFVWANPKKEDAKPSAATTYFEHGRERFKEGDFTTAFHDFQRGATLDNQDAQQWLGHCYLHGFGTVKDPVMAKELFLMLAKKQHPGGWRQLVQMYLEEELKKPGVSNVVRPFDVALLGRDYLNRLASGNPARSFDEIEKKPFRFGAPYKVGDESSLPKGLATARNLDLVWTYNKNKDKDYQDFREKLVEETATKDLPTLRDAFKKDGIKGLYDTFVAHLEKLGKKRREIAKKFKTKKAVEFGHIRWFGKPNSEGLNAGPFYTAISPESPDTGGYQVWGRHVKETVFTYADALIKSQTLMETPWIEDKDDGLARSRFRIRLLKDYCTKEGCDFHDPSCTNFFKCIQDYCCVKFPESYGDFTLNDFNAGKAQFLMLEIEIGWGSTFYPCTRIGGAFKVDPSKPNGFSNMSLATFLVGPLMASHAHSKNLKPLLDIAAKSWHAAITANSKNKDEVIDRIARTQYVIDHTSPFIRGSGAIAEYIAESLFKLHGYDVYLAPGTISMVQVGLGVPLSEFRTLYPQMVRIQPHA